MRNKLETNLFVIKSITITQNMCQYQGFEKS